MKKKVSLERLVLILLAAVALAGFVVSPALGGPGFLTKKKASKIFLKKSAANRLFFSKGAADSRFLSKADAESRFATKGEAYTRSEADSRFLRPEGEIRIAAGPTNWVVGQSFFEAPVPSPAYFIDAVRLRSTSEAIASANLTPELPSVLYGRAIKIAGVELCYDAEENAKLQAVLLEKISESTGIGAPPPITEVVSDSTPRTDNACRTYKAPSPVSIEASEYVVLAVLIDYPTNAQHDFMIGRTTFLLQA